MAATTDQLLSRGEHLGIKHKETALQMKQTCGSDSLNSINQTDHFSMKNPAKEYVHLIEDHSGSDSDVRRKKNASSSVKSAKPLKVSGGPDSTEEISFLHLDTFDPTLPTEVMDFICWLNH